MKKLISMADYVLQNKLLDKYNTENDFNFACAVFTGRCTRYANFMKQPLKLGFFVPCDEDGTILEKPKDELIIDYLIGKDFKTNTHDEDLMCLKYGEAQERVLFKDISRLDIEYICNGKNEFTRVEDLVFMKIGLTEQALKQFKL